MQAQPLQGNHRDQSEDGEEPDHYEGELFEKAVAPDRDDDCHDEGGEESPPDQAKVGQGRDLHENEGHSSHDPADLQELEGHDEEPDPDREVPPAKAGTGQVIEGLHGGPAGVDGVFAELELEGDLDEAGENDDPEADEAGLGPEEGGGKEFPGTHDGGREDKPGSEKAKFAREGGGGLEDVILGEAIRVFSHGVEQFAWIGGLAEAPNRAMGKERGNYRENSVNRAGCHRRRMDRIHLYYDEAFPVPFPGSCWWVCFTCL